jgi:hypothetical protein
VGSSPSAGSFHWAFEVERLRLRQNKSRTFVPRLPGLDHQQFKASKGCKRPSDKGADVRIESRDDSQKFNTVKTDTKGRYISESLPVGAYRVTLVVNSAVKASIANTRTKADQTTQLNFELKPVPAAQASAEQKKEKHMV